MRRLHKLRLTRILKLFFALFVLIAGRVWYLSVATYDEGLAQSQIPQVRTEIEQPMRGTIRDRFNTPLATNKILYNATILYDDIRQVPRVAWETDERGKRKRVLKRTRYVENLSEFLGQHLSLDPQDVEDAIYGNASLFPRTPFVIKEDISEELFYQLKMAEKDWVGLHMQEGSQRVYPYGKCACDVVGYLGAISDREYRSIARETATLKNYLSERRDGRPALLPEGFASPLEVEERLHELTKISYGINDKVGKGGIEGAFDEALHGIRGKKQFATNIQGESTHLLPESTLAKPGERVILNLSIELQEEAEKLLAESELLQEDRDRTADENAQLPWIRGGAIVALDPKTGEVLALASHPRFDPNDLVPANTLERRLEKRDKVIRWLESESYLATIWDGIAPLERERYSSREGSFYTETKELDWEEYLNRILSENSAIKQTMSRIQTVGDAMSFLIGETDIELPFSRDQNLLTDLLRLVVFEEKMTPSLTQKLADLPLADHRLYSQLNAATQTLMKTKVRSLFHTHVFKTWRKDHFRKFLREKRKVEQKRRSYARPYTDYLRAEEGRQFNEFWDKWKGAMTLAYFTKCAHTALPFREEILQLRRDSREPLCDELDFLLSSLSPEEQSDYIDTLRPFSELNRPLIGRYPRLRNENGVQLEKHLAAAFYPSGGYGYGRSYAYRQATPMGSIFKIIPAYAGLMHKYNSGSADLNPFTVVDDQHSRDAPNPILGSYTNGQVIRRRHRGGILPRAYPNIGKIGLVDAIERSSNIYFSLLAAEVLPSPNTLIETATLFGLGCTTGIELPYEYGGLLPQDLLTNKTGLYSFAIGQHSLVATPLQAATALSSIANGGDLLTPQVVKLTADQEKVDYHFPKVSHSIPLPSAVRTPLIEGMRRVIQGDRGSARPSVVRSTFQPPTSIRSYKKLQPQIIGKTGTAEIYYKPFLDAETRARKVKHVWFEMISFTDDSLQEPELVVVVFQRFGTAGKQGAPLCARMIEKWRQIKN